MNCHAKVRTDSVKLLPVRESYADDTPIPWVRVHNLPDYVLLRLTRSPLGGRRLRDLSRPRRSDGQGDAAEAAHDGLVPRLPPRPGPYLRDLDEITKMAWKPKESATERLPAIAANGRHVDPPKHCSGCHR